MYTDGTETRQGAETGRLKETGHNEAQMCERAGSSGQVGVFFAGWVRSQSGAHQVRQSDAGAGCLALIMTAGRRLIIRDGAGNSSQVPPK